VHSKNFHFLLGFLEGFVFFGVSVSRNVKLKCTVGFGINLVLFYDFLKLRSLVATENLQQLLVDPKILQIIKK
jgi:hypothetical protein